MIQKRVEVSPGDSSGESWCIATFLPLRRWRDVIPFLRMSARVEKQLKQTPGLVRYGLRADLLHKRFWTFSVWPDKGSVNALVKSEPHATAMRYMSDWAGEGAAFVEWNSSNGSIKWKDAMERLQQPSFYYRSSAG